MICKLRTKHGDVFWTNVDLDETGTIPGMIKTVFEQYTGWFVLDFEHHGDEQDEPVYLETTYPEPGSRPVF